MVKPISVYDNRTRKRLAYLENAYNISYNKNTNLLWTAEFSLPFSDPKTRYCQPFNYVEIWEENGDQAKYIGLFRIMPSTEEVLGDPSNIIYTLEHVLSTLIGDVMTGYHEIGNMGVYTPQVLGYILDKQIERNWILGVCEYEHQFLYGWQDENLLSALFSVVQPFEETDYYWDFNTKSYPWTLDLKKTKKEPVTDIRYKKNLSGLTRTVDPTGLTTRLYCYGYGQGDNKLGISDVNDGLPYLESINVSKYGVITQIWTDERFTIAESLKEVGENLLRRLEEPSVSYEIDIQSVYNAADLQIGDTVRMISAGIDELMVVRSISKDDVTGTPYMGTILLGDATIDVSNSLAELADRQRIAETYSQGAESIFTDSFVDNADQNNPADIRFTIPDNVVHVNEIRFSCQLTSFRAYSRAIQGGGGKMTSTLDGGSSSPTSSYQPAQVVASLNSPSKASTSLSGGGWNNSTENSPVIVPTMQSNGGIYTTLDVYNVLPDSSSSNGGPGTPYHNHGFSLGTQFVTEVYQTKNADGVVTGVSRTLSSGWRPSGDHRHLINVAGHTHGVQIPSHTHPFEVPNHVHSVDMPTHTHDVPIPAHSHTVSIGNHTHDISLENHTHQIEYGIYKGPKATEYAVYLDDNKIGDYTENITNLNLIDYMSKSANGNIMRGDHTIRIIPNNLTRVECTFQIRLFTNMHGGKQY